MFLGRSSISGCDAGLRDRSCCAYNRLSQNSNSTEFEFATAKALSEGSFGKPVLADGLFMMAEYSPQLADGPVACFSSGVRGLPIQFPDLDER